MKKGFTLIELLAIIVILSIIALITTPIILNIIQTSKENAFIDTGYSLIKAANNYQATNDGQENPNLTVNYTTKENIDKIKIQGALPDKGTLTINENGKTTLSLCSDNAKICISKTENDKKIKKDETLTQNTYKEVNHE